MEQASVDELLSLYPVLQTLPEEVRNRDLPRLPFFDVPERTFLFREDQTCQGFPFVLRGQVRVARGSATGKALELYRVGAGDICVVSAGCLFGSTNMTAHGVATAQTKLCLVDRDTLVRWTESPEIRMFVFGAMADRMADLMELVEAIAFQRLDQRLARALLGHGSSIRATHQDIADELGTAREMVSRLLKRFEQQGIVALHREQLEIRDPKALREICG